MRLWTISDLHLEDGVPPPSSPAEFDVLVCAGDVHEGDPVRSVEAIATLAADRPAIFVLGNHDVWGQTLEEAIKQAHSRGAELGVHVLENSSIDLQGVRFHGATLWTDGLLNQPVVTTPDWTGLPPGSRAPVFHPAHDFGEPVYVQGPGMDRRAKGRDIIARHRASEESIAAAMEQSQEDGIPLVVVTHYAPHPDIIHPLKRSHPSAAMSASDLTHLTDSGEARLWIFGHVHHTADFIAGYGTRLICNARGGRIQNPLFNPSLTIDIEPKVTFKPASPI